jgi:membrane protein DedA with SNARE-associated domain
MAPHVFDLPQLIHTYGVLIVFLIVLLEQIGLPIPAFPVLIVAGALAVNGGPGWPLQLAVILGASLVACLISDYFWFRAGRYFGRRILSLLCKISLSPDSCVSQTHDNFMRWGDKSLVVAKFIPGFNTIAPPLAGPSVPRPCASCGCRWRAAWYGAASASAWAPGSTRASTTSSPGSSVWAAPP